MSKSLQKGIIFAVCVALILALSLTLVFFAGGGDKNILSAPQGQVSATAQNTTSYTHGSYIKRQVPSGTEVVRDGTTFKDKVAANETFQLGADIELNPGGGYNFTNSVYSGTIYGNGYTVSFRGDQTGNNFSEGRSWVGGNSDGSGWSNWGAIAGTLTGNIFDLNVHMTGYQVTIMSSGNLECNVGGFVGRLNGGKIDNCTMTYDDKNSARIAALKSGEPGWGGSHAWCAAGGLVGRLSSGTITNVTVNLQGWFEAGTRAGSGNQGNLGTKTNSVAGGIAGYIEGGKHTMNNIKLHSEGGNHASVLNAQYVGFLGMMSSGGCNITVTNFYNDFILTENYSDNNGASTTFAHYIDGGSFLGTGNITNCYVGNGATTNISNSSEQMKITGIESTINVPDTQNVYFDPKTTDYANSLAVVFTGRNKPASGKEYEYTISGSSGVVSDATFTTDDSGTTRTVVARNLPTAIGTWGGNNGTFNATLNETEVDLFNDYLPDPTVYEHGYVPADYKAAADSIQITSAEQFMSLFRPNGDAITSTPYVLMSDIVISGFSGIDFSGGTLDGAGHTIYIIDKLRDDPYDGPAVGGLVGQLGGGTIKNLRIVYVNSIDITVTNSLGRIGLVAGSVNGGTIQNVEVIVQEGVTIGATNRDDHEFAMGGVVGEAANNAQITDVTLDHNGRLNPTGKWQFLAGIAGVVKADPASPSLGATFTNVALRGAGKLGGHALNDGQPTFTGAFAVLMPSSGADPTGAFVKADGLIYDFDVTLDGTVETVGNSNGKYSCYYLFTYNYNNRHLGEEDGGYKPNSPITEYNKAVEYSNVFIASDYVDEMAAFAGERTNGNAAVGGATINTVKGTVYGAAGSDVTAYFNPVDGDNDMIFRATRTTGSWMTDDMVQLVGSDGKLYQSAMEIAGDHSSPKLVYAPKGVAATDNVVQLTMPSNVLRPEFGSDVLPLTYNGQEQSFVFTLKLNNADQTPLTEDDFTVTYRLADASTGSLGSNSLPVNAGEYIATIVLKNGYKFIAEGQGTETDTYELTVEISPYTVEINSAFDFDAAYGEIGLNGGVISGGKFTAENLFANYADLSSTFPADIPGIAEITVAAADSSQITASGAGKLPVGSYTVAEIKLDDTNFAATDYVGTHLIAFEVTQKSVSAQIAINKDLPNAFTGSEFDLVDGDFTPTFTTLESGDVVTLEYLINDGALTIYDAGEYVFTAKIADGGDGGNYSLGSYEFAGLTDNKHTVGKYTVTGSWAFADGAALVYGTPVSDPSALITTDFSGNTVTVDESMVEVEVFLEATDEPWKENMPAGTEVTVVVNITFNDTNFEKGEITAPESDRLTVQKRTIGVTDVTTPEDPYFPLMSVEYGSKEINSDDTLTTAFNDHQYATGGYITDIYKDDQPEFVVKLYLGEDADDGSMVAGSTPATWSDLNAYTGYVAVVELADAEGNYVMDKEADHFVFQVAQKEVIVTGVTLDGFDGEYVFDGKAHNVVITISTELVGDDTVADILTADVTSVTNAGDHIIVVNPVTNEESFTAADNYAFTFENGSGDLENEYTITIAPYDLKNATVTIAESGLVYTGSAITVTPIVKGGENDFTGMLDVVVNDGEDVVNAGEYTITASDTENSGNFNGSIEKAFTVAQKQLKLESLTLSSLTYTGAPITVADHTFAADFGPADGEQPELSIVEETGATVQDAGTYTFDVTLKEASTYPVNANYVIAADGAKITATVSPATVTVTAGKNAELGALYGESATAETSRFYESDFITLSPQPDETFTLSAALTFTVTNSASETVSPVGGKYTLEPGTYTVTYTIENVENANYTLTPGDTLTTTLTVKEGALKLEITGWNNTSLTYNGMAQLPTPVFADSAEIGEKIEEGALVYEVTAKEGALTGSDAVNAGSYTVTVSVAEDYKEKYELVGGEPSTDFTIAPATLNITQTAEETLTRPYDGTTTEATSFLTEKYVTITGGVSGENIYGMLNASLTEGGEIKNAGAYTITVTFNAEAEGSGNYSVGDFTSLEIVYTVNAKTITITFGGYEDLTYNGQARTLTATADFVSGENIDLNALIAYTGNVTDGKAVNAGSYTATITKAQIKESNANYTLAAESATQEFTISPATLTLTQKEGAQLSRVYDGTATEAGAFVSADYFTVSGYMDDGNVYALFTAAVAEGLTIQNADSYTINITINSGAEGAGNYVLAEDATVEFTIAPKSIGVAWENTAFTYNGLAQVPTANVGEAQGLITGDDLQITVSGAETDANTDGGSYTATAAITGGEDMGNYVLAEDATVEFTIARKTVSVAWENTAFTYNGSAQKPNATVGEEQGLVAGDDLQITVSGAQTNASADAYKATAEITGGEDMGNYVLAEDATVEFTISRKIVSVAWDDTELTYNGSAQAPTAKIAEDGLIGEDEVILTVNGEQTDVNTSGGSYTATAEITGGADKDNYVLDNTASTSFTIAPKPITITFTANDGANTINFDVAGSVKAGAWTADGSDPNKATLTLSDGVTDVTLTAEANEALPLIDGVPALVLLLDNEIYEGTPYGTEVKGGSLTVVSTNTNYVFEGAQEITINITPAISVGLKADVETERGLTDVLKTAHNADYFKDNYLQVTGKDGAEVTGGTLEVTITPSEGLEEGAIKHAGTYTVKAVYTPEGAGESAELPTFSFEFIVTPVKVTSVTYSGEPLVYGDLSESGVIAVTVEYADGTKAENVTAQYTSENVSTARYVKAGEQTIKVSYTNNNSDYAAVTEHVITVTVAQKTITPSAISYGEVTSVDKTLTLNYAGKSAYDGNLAIATDDILSSDAGSDVVEFISEKDYSAANEEGYTLEDVKIGDAGDGGNYKLDLSGWKVVVLKKTIEVTVTAENDTYTGSAIKLTAESKEVVGEDDVTFTVSGENVNVVDQTVTNAGTYALTVTLGGEQGGNYEVAGELSVTINKARVNIVWTNEDELKAAVYNGQPYEATADVMFNDQSVGSASIKYTSDEVTVTEAVNAGSYTAEATFAGTDNFNATTASYDFTIAKMVLNGEWKVASDMNMTYDGTSKAGYATWTWTTQLVNEGDVTVGYKYELNNAIVGDVIDAGNYNVYAVFTDNTGNYDTESGILQGDRFDELTVARRAVTVKWSERVSFTYNGAEQAPAATAQNVAEGDSLTLIVTGAETDAGSYTATVAAASVTGNYVLAEDATVEFTITPKPIDVAWSNTEFTYDGTAHKPTATATGWQNGENHDSTLNGLITIGGNDTQALNAGDYTATITKEALEAALGNYTLAEESATKAFTIAKADLTVTPASLEIRERETDVMQAFAEGEDLAEAFAGRISVSGVSGTVSYTVAIAGDNNYDDDGLLTVGAHTFTIDAGSNYNAASVRVTVIATTVVTVIASVEGELVYNGSAFEISYALKEGAPVDVSMDDITVTASVETIVNAGEYEVTFTVTGSNEDYDYVVQDASGNAALTFTIARRGLDVAEVAEAVYGNLQVSGTLVTGTHSAFVAYNDEEIELIVNVKTAALSRAAAEYLDAGEYEVTIALANEQGNFSLNGATLNAETEKMEVESTLDVAPKTVTVGYTPSSPVYDAKGISITLDKFEGMLIEGDDPAVNIYINDAPYTGKVVLDAGEYTVRYESADPNYAFAPVSATFTIAPKSVTPNFDLNTGSGSQQITGGGKLEIEEGEETDIVAAIDSFMQSSGVPEEEMSIAVSGDLKLEDMATWAPGTYTVTVTLSGNHSGSMQFTVEVSEKVELPPPVQPELPETPVEAGSGNDWVLPLIIAIVALIDLALLVAIGVAAKKRA